MRNKIVQGHVTDVLKTLADEYISMVITSPPYWGLRDYHIPPQIWGGDSSCNHQWETERTCRPNSSGGKVSENNKYAKKLAIKGTENYSEFTNYNDRATYSNFCIHCGAWLGSLGLEPNISMFVDHIIEIFREVRRVLRSDGTVWLNLGDSYAGSGGEHKPWHKNDSGFQYQDETRELSKGRQSNNPKSIGLKPKDLCGIPWRCALALQDDGWYLRQDIIWHKMAPMPESVTDRCTKSHEYIFLLAKSKHYFFDHIAIQEPSNYRWNSAQSTFANPGKKNIKIYSGHNHPNAEQYTRNKRSVWSISSQPLPFEHFAHFPEALVEPCILAGTSAKGNCVECGTPWKRISDHNYIKNRPSAGNDLRSSNKDKLSQGRGHGGWQGNNLLSVNQFVGWEKQCECVTNEVVPALVLDPFMGAGTSALIAKKLGRDYLGIELNESYIDIANKRLEEVSMPLFENKVAENAEQLSLL